MPKKKASKDDPTRVSKKILEEYFKEAVSNNEILWPDEAIKKLEELITRAAETNAIDLKEAKLENPRIDIVAINRELHHYAVDLFYKTYYERTGGAPELTKEYLEYIVRLKDVEKLTFGQIAIKIGETPKSADKIRKQYDIAKKKGIEPASPNSQEKEEA